MYASLRARLLVLAKKDNDREAECGAPCPTELTIALANGDTLTGYLLDGLNSVDDQTIVVYPDGAKPDRQVWIVQIAHIAALGIRYPGEGQYEAARARGRAAEAGA